MNSGLNHKPLVTSGIFMTIGLAGFFDGILFHQLLQIHNLLTAKFPNYAFAASGVILILGGWLAIRSAHSDGVQPRSSYGNL